MTEPGSNVAFLAPETTWSISLLFEEVASRLCEAGHDVTLYRSNHLVPALRDYDRVVTHFNVPRGFGTDLWDDIRGHTWVWSSGINYRAVPWDRIPNAIAQSEWLAERMPGSPDVCQAGVDPETFYPSAVEPAYRVGAVGNATQEWKDFDVLAETFADFHHHDGWNGEFVSRDAMRQVYNSFETLAMVSRFEGGGMPLLEAGACGCGVVSTPTGYAPNLDGVETVPFDPDPAELIDAVERAEPFVSEVRSEWTWSELLPKWTSTLELPAGDSTDHTAGTFRKVVSSEDRETIDLTIDPRHFDERHRRLWAQLVEEHGEATIDRTVRSNLSGQTTRNVMAVVEALWNEFRE